MKKNLKYMLIACCAFTGFLMSGCTDLETEFTDSLQIEQTDDGFTGVNVEESLFAAYGRLGDIVGSSYTGVSNLNEGPSDELIIPTRSTDWGNGGIHRLMQAHAWDASHPDLLDLWNDMNRGIYTCTQILASSPNTLQAAEAKALRGYYTYWVVDFFGQLPFREVNQGVDEYPMVMSRNDAFNFMIDDLESALPHLPEGGPDTEDPTKMTKAAVHALLARAYLNKAVYTGENPAGPYNFAKADMDKVIEHADAVRNAGFEYEEDYFNNFTADGMKEAILTYTRWWSGMWIWPQLHNSQGGWNGATTFESFYNIFEDNDQRKGYVADSGVGRGFLIGPQYGEDGNQLLDRGGNPLSFTTEVKLTGNPDYAGIRVLKYDPSNAGGFKLLRFADVRLMKAEAILRGGTGTLGETAQSIVDELRAVRGAGSITVNLDMMLDERGRELYWEGIRRVDQIRFMTFTKTTWEEKEIMDDNLVIYPIPRRAMDSNPNFIQNPGYR